MSVFPFNLHGPQFLLFFVAFGTALVILVPLLLVRLGRDPRAHEPLPRLTDIYAVAALRGRREEAVRLAVLSMVDRGILVRAGKRIDSVAERRDLIGHPLERAVFNYFASGKIAIRVFSDRDVRAATRVIDERLLELGLRKPASERASVFVLSVGIMVMVALIRVVQSPPPHGYLLLLVIAFVIAGIFVAAHPRNSRGDRTLIQMRELFARLRQRMKRSTVSLETAERALVAAVFGLSAFPASTAGALTLLRDASGGDGGGSCGSSSSCGSGGGCGGGGGGCGGGCGS